MFCIVFADSRFTFLGFSNPYFSINVEVLETRLPSLSASSLLCLSFRASSEKSPSSPVAKGNCRQQKYLMVSAVYFSTSVVGEMAFPRDLEIFLPLKVRKPWLKTVFGRGKPAALRNAGQ